MTESEAVEKLKNMRLFMQITERNSEHKFTEDDYKANEMAIQALEKQIPKKPIFNHNYSDTLSVFHCECRNIIKVSHNAGTMDNNDAPNYCSKCGCKLDWSDKESEETKL